jgi:mRNA interferase RelE/StbE
MRGRKGEFVKPSYEKQAQAYLAKQPERKAERIIKAVERLPAGDVKKLRGIENGYRLRVGDVRVLFEQRDGHINVIKIDNRGDVYK